MTTPVVVVWTAFAWLASVFTILGFMAEAGAIGPPKEFTYPTNYAKQEGADGEPPEDKKWLQEFAQCSSPVSQGGTSFGQLFRAAANLASFGVLCATIATFNDITDGVTIPVIDGIVDAVRIAIGTIVFLFQMITYTVSQLPAAVNVLIFVPPGIALVYVAVTIARGSGG